MISQHDGDASAWGAALRAGLSGQNVPRQQWAWAMMGTARVPLTLLPQTFWVWEIERVTSTAPWIQVMTGWRTQTRLLHGSGDVVMEDSWVELRKHLPIWRRAHGRVLVTGLGLGCVLRGLLARPEVEHIDVIEIDRHILRVVGAEFAANPRVTLHEGDALRWPVPRRRTWDYGWHDLYAEEGLHVLHARCLTRFRRACAVQGAWQFPRAFKRRWPGLLLGSAGLS